MNSSLLPHLRIGGQTCVEYATHLLTSSKKGISSHQLSRMLGVTYKTAWFMGHRIRESMRPKEFTPIGGEGQTVEVDETIIGFQEGVTKEAKRQRQGAQYRNVVLSVVTRGGGARSWHINGTTLGTLLPIIRMNISRESNLMTDEASWYKSVGAEFASHGRVNHKEFEYVRGTITTNTVEGYFSIFNRGMKGIYQHCSEKHLHHYLSEFDFRYSNRIALGVDDAMRTDKVPGSEWQKTGDPETASRAVKEYLATLDDAAFGAASHTTPKFVSPSDPAALCTTLASLLRAAWQIKDALHFHAFGKQIYSLLFEQYASASASKLRFQVKLIHFLFIPMNQWPIQYIVHKRFVWISRMEIAKNNATTNLKPVKYPIY